MRISDWSSDVCSSDLSIPPGSTICFNECCWTRYTSPSSRGLGHHPFTVDTGVRIPVGTPSIRPQGLPQGGPCRFSAALSLPLCGSGLGCSVKVSAHPDAPATVVSGASHQGGCQVRSEEQ